MKKISIFFTIFTLLFMLVSCNTYNKESGDIITKTYSNNEAQSLVIENLDVRLRNKKTQATKVYLSPSDERKVEIKSNESMFNNLKVSTASNKVSITSKNNVTYLVDEFEIYIYGYQFSSVNVEDLELNTLNTNESSYVFDQELLFEASDNSTLNISLHNVLRVKFSLDDSTELYANNVNLNKMVIEGDDSSYCKIENANILELEAELYELTKFVISGECQDLKLTLSDNGVARFQNLHIKGISNIVSRNASTIYGYFDGDVTYNLSGASHFNYSSKGNPNFIDCVKTKNCEVNTFE